MMAEKLTAREVVEGFAALSVADQKRVVNALMQKHQYMSDMQVCTVLQITPNTLRRYLNEGPPAGGIDLRKLKPTIVGGQRRWSYVKLQQMLGN